MLEEVLLGFQGTVLIVSHDRAFLDNVVTSTLVFEGNGLVREYVGGYQDWLRQGGSIKLLGVGDAQDEKQSKESKQTKADSAPAQPASEPAPVRKKLSYKDQRELEALPGKIDAAEQEIAALQAAMAEPGFYQQPAAQTSETIARLEGLQQTLDQLLERWAELEG